MSFNVLSLLTETVVPAVASAAETCRVNGQIVPCGEAASVLAGIGMSFLAIMMVLLLLILVGTWKVFEKAGKPGWASIIPIYNIIVMLEITGYPPVLVLLMFVPVVNIILALLLNIKLAEVFGRGAGFAIGLILLPFIFIPILGFGDSVYTKPAGAPLV